MLKKALAALPAIILTFALFASGCGGVGGNSSSDPTPTREAEAGAQDEAAETDSRSDEIAAAQPESWLTKDYAGTVVKYLGAEYFMFVTNKINWGYAYYMGMLEWQEKTGATIECLPALEIPQVLAGISAGEGYDIGGNGAFYSMNDHLEYLDDYIGHFAGKFGAHLTNLLGTNIYNGRHIAISQPWNHGCSAMLYNVELLNRLGRETPHEMFMRGEWTWDSYWEIVKYVGQLDLDGDGVPDYVATANAPHFEYMVRVFEEQEDGTYVSIADSQRLRDFAEMIYNGYNIYDIYQEEMPSPWNYYSFSSERYPWMCTVGIPAYDPTCFFGFVDNVGEALEWVPMPSYAKDGKDTNLGYGAVSLLKGGQNKEGALHFIDFICGAVGDSAMQMVTQGRIDYGFEGMTGNTRESADFLEWWENFIDGEYERFTQYPHYDWSYYEACLEYWEETLPKRDGAPHGWRSSNFWVPDWKLFVDYPPATAVSMYVEELQAVIDEHNDFISNR